MWKLSYQITFAPEKYEKYESLINVMTYIYVESPIVNLPILGSLSFIVCPNANGILESAISIV
jgi:hypothetical protein